MKRLGLLGFILVMLLAAWQLPLSKMMENRPITEKAGYVVPPSVLRLAAADQRELTGALIALKSLFYYGNMVEEAKRNHRIPVDYSGLQRILYTATQLDPYNMDAYYFAQAILVWDAGMVVEVNSLLENGMRYRTWDWSLPFWAGFNSAQFLKNYEQSAAFYRLAGDISGIDIFSKLSARYLYESGQTSIAIAYLDTMVKGARKPAIRQSFATRLEAFKQVKVIETALDQFRAREGHLPASLDNLVAAGDLPSLPRDPYGGTFFLTEAGQVRTTSGFSFGNKGQQ